MRSFTASSQTANRLHLRDRRAPTHRRDLGPLPPAAEAQLSNCLSVTPFFRSREYKLYLPHSPKIEPGAGWRKSCMAHLSNPGDCSEPVVIGG